MSIPKRPATEAADVGPWARDKLALLKEYLTAYARVLTGSLKQRGWPKRIVYVDAFAGSGRARVRGESGAKLRSLFAAASSGMRAEAEVRELLDGSPIVALRIEPPLTDLLFIESNARRAENLRAAIGSDPRARVVATDCNDFLVNELLQQSRAWWQQTRALVFLDPFGMQVPWSTIESLARTRGVEIILNLPVGMAIQRLLRRTGRFSDSEREKLDEYFGDPGWHACVYGEERGLFDSSVAVKCENVEYRLVEWYLGRLRQSFGHAAGGFPVRNTRGKILYHLLWAGPHAKGREIATRVFSATGAPKRRSRTAKRNPRQ